MLEKIFLNDGARDFNYIIYEPQSLEDVPLIIYLHGAGERGKTVDHLYRHAVPKLLKTGKEVNALVLCPQCPAGYVWNNLVYELKGLIDKIVCEYNISKDRIAITGSSMGGFGTWEMGLTYRNFFSAIAPVAGGGMSWRCRGLKTTPVFAYHGENDDAVPARNSVEMANAVNVTGGKADITVLENFGHNDFINYVYENTNILDLLINSRRTNFEYVQDVCEDCF